MTNQIRQKLIDHLTGFVTPARRQRFDSVLSNRTSHMHIVLENIYQAHNASAVLRSCDCFGIQHVHFIENRNSMRINEEVAMGSGNWLTVHRHRHEDDNTGKTLRSLKEKGMKIFATSPHANGVSLDKVRVTEPFALVFGTELEGITDDVRAEADEFVTIPMYGFTESFNISVSAALCMYDLTTRLRESGVPIALSEDERLDILLKWLTSSIDKGEYLRDKFLEEQ